MKGPHIGTFRNNWRGRIVRIFADSERLDMVYTEGVSLTDPHTVIETHEPRALYAQYIGSHNKIYS